MIPAILCYRTILLVSQSVVYRPRNLQKAKEYLTLLTSRDNTCLHYRVVQDKHNKLVAAVHFPRKVLMSIIPAPRLGAHPKAADWTYFLRQLENFL